MRIELSRLHHELGSTMIYVTHDQVEAMTLADKVVIMDVGEVAQIARHWSFTTSLPTSLLPRLSAHRK